MGLFYTRRKSLSVYRIVTENFIIRCYEQKDAPLYRDAVMGSIKELSKWMSWENEKPDSLEENIEKMRRFRGNFDLGDVYKYGIFDLEEKELIGTIGLHLRREDTSKEIGYWINTKFAGKGYATEAVKAIIKVGFEIEGMTKFVLRCKKDNIKSIRIPEKLNFQKVVLDKEEKFLFRLTKTAYNMSNISDIKVKAYNGMNKEIVNTYFELSI